MQQQRSNDDDDIDDMATEVQTNNIYLTQLFIRRDNYDWTILINWNRLRSNVVLYHLHCRWLLLRNHIQDPKK